MYSVAILLAMVYNIFFYALTQSMAFFIGKAEGIGSQLFMGFITLSTYPTDIFNGWGKIMLFTIIPAGFISYMPIGFLRDADVWFMGQALAAALLLGGSAVGLFYWGLSHYNSGNRIGLRG